MRGERRKQPRKPRNIDRRKSGITRTPGRFKDAVDAVFHTERKLREKKHGKTS